MPSRFDPFASLSPDPSDSSSLDGDTYSNGYQLTNGHNHTSGDHLTNGHTYTNGDLVTNGNSSSSGNSCSTSPEMLASPSDYQGMRVSTLPPSTIAAPITVQEVTAVQEATAVLTSPSYYKERISFMEQRCEHYENERRMLLTRIKELEVALEHQIKEKGLLSSPFASSYIERLVGTSSGLGNAPATHNTSATAPSSGSANKVSEGPTAQDVPAPTVRFPSESSKGQLATIPENDKHSSEVPSGIGMLPHEANLAEGAIIIPMLMMNLDGTVSGIDTPTQAQHPHLPTGVASGASNQLDDDPALTGPLGLGRQEETDKAFLSGVQSRLQEEQQNYASPSSAGSSSASRVSRDPRIHESPEDEPRLRLKKSTNFGTEFGSTRIGPDIV
ncbi:MAG: hypothetical protein M1812_003376 [Candelaria pacifica]|nr:MAG: hypothetical protein M1812_003376 [Candelaria pacifica]